MGKSHYIFIFAIILCCEILCSVSSCPSACTCKWKGGKKTVECADRGLIMIPDGIDSETQVLDVSGNNLQILPHDTFYRSGLINLQKLYLRHCQLGQIDDTAFRGLTNLIEIDLSDNLLTYIPSHAFNDIPYLRNISLAKNPIQKIDPLAFHSVNGLLKLDLSHCNIQWIGPKAFDGLQVLEQLKLNDNSLTELPENTVDNLRSIRTIELHGNNWRCDCRLRAARTWLAEYGIHIPVAIYCNNGPERIKNKAIMELDLDDFACKPEIKSDNRMVESFTGTNTTIECRVESDPVARISWYWNGRLLSNKSMFGNTQRIFISESEENVYNMRSKLLITKVELTDAGQYYCVAENRAGNDEANFTLTVNQTPTSLVPFSFSNVNVISIFLIVLILIMLIVIVILVKKIKRTKFPDNSSIKQQHVNDSMKKIDEKPNPSETSSNSGQSHDSENRSEFGKAFTVTSDLSYSRSLSDIGNTQFSNPDLINGANIIRGSMTPLPITRPISDYCNNWQKSYDMQRAASSAAFTYDPNERIPAVMDTMSAASGSDDVFTNSRMSNDYPADYGLPILRDDNFINQPCAKTLKVWQKGVPVYPPMCASNNSPHYPTLYANPNPPFPTRQPGCGTDV